MKGSTLAEDTDSDSTIPLLYHIPAQGWFEKHHPQDIVVSFVAFDVYSEILPYSSVPPSKAVMDSWIHTPVAKSYKVPVQGTQNISFELKTVNCVIETQSC